MIGHHKGEKEAGPPQGQWHRLHGLRALEMSCSTSPGKKFFFLLCEPSILHE